MAICDFKFGQIQWQILIICCRSVAKLCPTLCNSLDHSLPGSSVHRISQVRILECVAISFSRDLPDSGIEPMSPALQIDYLSLSHLGNPIHNLHLYYYAFLFFFGNHSLTGVFVCLLKKRFSFLKSLKIVATYNLKKDLEPPPMLLSQELYVE